MATQRDAHTPVTEIVSTSSLPPGHFGYKLVGDNIDMSVKARYVQVGVSRNRSLHYFHTFAVKNRVDLRHLPDVHPDIYMLTKLRANCMQTATINR